ncbi:MAG: ParB/RepB/Spo0J family partition protein [Alphaproteobacteria bacterium]|nr:ParB/RepB/Spo0J family partition protein [Alphaproteobacteria bacterium]
MTKSKSGKNRGLGRGLSALMADADISPAAPEGGPENQTRKPDIFIPIEKIHPNPDQPRRDFVKSDLEELTASIREKGIIQPLLVRADPNKPGDFQIVAGERRWRAAQQANLHELPVLVRELDDMEVIELAIIENIQRADLNAVEEALGFRQLMDRFGHTQEKLASVLGKSRSHIANLLRLLSLPEEVLTHLREGKLTAGHARALVTADNPVELARKVIAKALSVRQTERLAKTIQRKPISSNKNKAVKDADTKELEQQLTAQLGMEVSIDFESGNGSGEVKVKYGSLDQLDDLCRLLTGGPQDESK